MDNEQTNGILEMYMDILSPLKNLKGLARFFAHLSDPSAWAKKRLERLDLKKLEQHIERCVMGEDFDAVAAGKYGLVKSRWLEDHEVYNICGAPIE
jgi:hypothetical protein